MERKDVFLALPVSVVGRVDVGRLRREVEAIDAFLAQAAIREPGTPMKLPKTSKFLDETLTVNRLNMLVEDDRNRLLHFLMEVYARAPMLHMSFSADPSPSFTQKLVAYLREEIHPIALLQVGLQPNIGAGCVVRTTNKYFDFSLRSRLEQRHDVLIEYLRKVAGVAPAPTPPPVAPIAPPAPPVAPAAPAAPAPPPPAAAAPTQQPAPPAAPIAPVTPQGVAA